MKPIYIIAEAGVNHNGKASLAFDLIDSAAAAGVDAVKFQTFKASAITTCSAPKCEYQLANTDDQESHQAMLQRLELPYELHVDLQAYCEKKGITFLSTAFDTESLTFLDQELNLPCFKIGSGEITNAPLLYEFAKTNKPLILSTGMSTLAEIEQALSVIAYGLLGGTQPSITEFKNSYLSQTGQEKLVEKVSLLHCTSLYPTPVDKVNLNAMNVLSEAFGLPVGYSDHTQGITVSIAAAAMGAKIIEKHFTLDQSLPGPDHRASLNPEQLISMVAAVRDVEAAMGGKKKIPCAEELETLYVARKSLIANKSIHAGEILNPSHIGIKRPAAGCSPMQYWDLLGKKAKQAVQQGESIE